MTDDELDVEYAKLNEAFESKRVLIAERKELEGLLLASAQCKPANPEHKIRQGRQADVLRHLLQVRISEEFQRRTYRMSIAAFIVSLLAVGIAAYRELGHRTVSQTAVAPVPAQSTAPAKK